MTTARQDLHNCMVTDEMLAVERRADGKLIGNIYLGRREAHLRRNVFFRQDERDASIWKDTCVYALLQEELTQSIPKNGVTTP